MSTAFYESVVVLRARSLLKNVNLPPRMSWITAKTAAWQHHLARIMNRQARHETSAQGGPVWASSVYEICMTPPRDLSAYCSQVQVPAMRLMNSTLSTSLSGLQTGNSAPQAGGKWRSWRINVVVHKKKEKGKKEALRSVINYLDGFPFLFRKRTGKMLRRLIFWFLKRKYILIKERKRDNVRKNILRSSLRYYR